MTPPLPAAPPQSIWDQKAPQAPAPAAGSFPQTSTQPLPNFFAAYHNADPNGAWPDAAYTAYQNKFFQDNVVPWAMAEGHPMGNLHSTFMDQTKRPGKAENPRTELVLKQALASLLAPTRAISPALSDWANTSEQAAEAEAVKQGINPAAYKLLGGVVGQAPYWAAGFGVGAEALESEIGLAAKAAKTVTAGVIQGSYDAASAPAGTRTTAGFKGALMGAGTVGAFEYAGPLAKFLTTKGVPAPEAAAVQKVAQGIATEGEENLAAKAMMEIPSIDESIADYVQHKTAAAKSVGIPQSAEVTSPNGKLTAMVTGADQKPYLLQDMTTKDTNNITQRVADHLAKGGSLDAMTGDPTMIHDFLNKIEGALGDAFAPPKEPTPFESAAEWVKGGMSVKDAAKRLSLPFSDLSDYLDSQLPPSTATTPNGLVRGSIDEPLNNLGVEHARVNAAKLSNQFDTLIHGDLTRTKQTAGAYLDTNPGATAMSDARWRSWARGEFEGGDPGVAQDFGKALSEEAPDVAYPGVSARSTQPGESFNQFKERVQSAFDTAAQIAEVAPGRVGVVTHANPIKLIDAWARGEGTDVDLTHFNTPDGEPGHVYKVDFGDDLRPTNVSTVDINGSNGELPPPDGKSLYLIRHGDTDMNPAPAPEDEMRKAVTQWRYGKPVEQTAPPLVNRPLATHSIPEYGDYASVIDKGTVNVEPEWDEYVAKDVSGMSWRKPDILMPRNMLGPELSNAKEITHHEMLHAHFGYLGMHRYIENNLNDSFVKDAFDSMPFDTRMLYRERERPEEVFNYLSGAIRSGNEDTIQKFIDSDTDRQTTLGWYIQRAKELLDYASEEPDSLHKRTLERRLNYTIAQASKSLDDVGAPFATTHDVGYEAQNGLFRAENLKTGDVSFSHDRELLLKGLEPNREPLNAPELVDMGNLPPTPRLGRSLRPPSTGRAPLTTDPPEPGPIEAGTLVMSNLFRPFYSWVGSVAQKFDRPALADRAEAVRDAWQNYANGLRPYAEVLNSTIAKPVYDGGRRRDFYKWIEATSDDQRSEVMRQFQFKPEELKDIMTFDNAFKTVEGFHEHVQNTIPEMRDNGWDVPTRFRQGMESGKSVIGTLMRQGRLDPRDEDLLKVADTILRGNMFRDHLKAPIDDFEDVINEEHEEPGEGQDKYVFGMVRPALQRQLQFWRSQPDFTQKVVFSAVQQGKDLVNAGIEGVNKFLPEGMQLKPITDPPRDILGKFILYNYAGALGLRPAVPVRDAIGFYLTSYPLLGEKYMWAGMTHAFDGKNSQAYQEALQNGWLLERHQLPESVAGGGETTTTQGGRWVNKAMSAITWSQNAKRLAAGHGFAEKIGDALSNFAETGDQKKFISESGLWFLDKPRLDIRLREAAAATASPADMRRFSLRAARDMVDATQWDYQKGAAPGIYKYQLGRLFGQYGTWPMNYIEYARKFLTRMPSEYRTEAIMGLTRLVLAHGAVLSAAQSVGIDASHWVFTQPMAYGGGPLYQAITNIPQSMDFETYKGAEARRQLIEPIWPGLVPGGDEAHNLWKAINDGDQNAWIRILGFTPMMPGEEGKGIHGLTPQSMMK